MAASDGNASAAAILRSGDLIVLSVGTQLPFDRLVDAVDRWAGETPGVKVVGQIGNSSSKPANMETFQLGSPSKMNALFMQASVIIAHAGTGSILTAMEYAKPIIVMPRDHLKGEHRNGHQLATARRFQDVPGVYVAFDEAELRQRLDGIDSIVAAAKVPNKAPQEFSQKLRSFLNG
jgi:UDP-N-acetylglucosamine transferase subunit ALG13